MCSWQCAELWGVGDIEVALCGSLICDAKLRVVQGIEVQVVSPRTALRVI